MTKKDLMEMLKNYEDDTVIVIAEDKIDPWSGHRYGVNLCDIEVYEGDNKDKKHFAIRQKN
jgi:hypothetical protein